MSERVPEPWGSLIDDVCEADQAFFDSHPGRRSYTRPVVAGEFWPVEVTRGLVRVILVAPGVRARQLIDPLIPIWEKREAIQ